MAAIVRLKRRRNENPHESLVLSCKRSKLDGEDDKLSKQSPSTVETLFKFAGTVDKKDSSVTSTVKKAISKEKLEKSYKQAQLQHGYEQPTLFSKRQNAQKTRSAQARLKVVEDKRAADWQALEAELQGQSSKADDEKGASARAEESQRFVCLYDVVSEEEEKPKVSQDEDVITCNGVAMTREKVVPPEAKMDMQAGQGEYVYDVYYMNNPKFDYRLLQNILSIEAFRDEEYVLEEPQEEEVYEDEDDENDEGNWRNDYPDEDPDGFPDVEPTEYEEWRTGYSSDEDGDFGSELPGLLQARLTLGYDDDGPKAGNSGCMYDSDEENPAEAGEVWTPSYSYNQYRAYINKHHPPH